MKCPSCTKNVKENLKFCPHCGMRIVAKSAPKPDRRRSFMKLESAESIARKWKIFAGIMIAAFGIYFGYIGFDAYRIEKSFKLCQFHRRTGSYTAGAEACEYLLGRRPKKVEAWLELVMIYKGMDDAEKLLKAVKDAQKWTESAELYAIEGEVLYLAGKITAAAVPLDTALSLEPDNRLANQYVGYLLRDAGEKEQAIKHLKAGLVDAGRMEQIEINEILGDLYVELKDYNNAIESYKVVKENNMNIIAPCMKLARAYQKQGMMSEALLESERCTMIEVGNKEADTLKRHILLEKDRTDTIKYIVIRKKLDDLLVMLYSSVLSYIERFNEDPDAFIGQENVELDAMIKDTEGLMESYRKLTPTDHYTIVHAKILATNSTLLDTMIYLRRFLKTGEQQHYTTLASYLSNSQTGMKDLVGIWDREFEEMDLKTILEENAAREKASGTTATPPKPTSEPDK